MTDIAVSDNGKDAGEAAVRLPCVPNSPLAEAENSQLSTFSSQPVFPRSPGETPRAFSAFMSWIQLGHARTHQAVADKLGEGLPTVKNWASRYDWSERLLVFNSRLLSQEAQDHAARQRKEAADWAVRLNRFREQEWDAAQKLISAAQCFLENFGEAALEKMTLSQVSRALQISSTIGRAALLGAELPSPSEPETSLLQRQMLDAVKRVYGDAGKSSATPRNPEVRMASAPSQDSTPAPSPTPAN